MRAPVAPAGRTVVKGLPPPPPPAAALSRGSLLACEASCGAAEGGTPPPPLRLGRGARVGALLESTRSLWAGRLVFARGRNQSNKTEEPPSLPFPSHHPPMDVVCSRLHTSFSRANVNGKKRKLPHGGPCHPNVNHQYRPKGPRMSPSRHTARLAAGCGLGFGRDDRDRGRRWTSCLMAGLPIHRIHAHGRGWSGPRRVPHGARRRARDK